MKYTVTTEFEGIVISDQFDLSKAEAIQTARTEAKADTDNQVFISWYRKSDGQTGYLNSDGDHAITGKAW